MNNPIIAQVKQYVVHQERRQQDLNIYKSYTPKAKIMRYNTEI